MIMTQNMAYKTLIAMYYNKQNIRQPEDCWPAPNDTAPNTFVLALAALGCPPRPPNIPLPPNIPEPSIG